MPSYDEDLAELAGMAAPSGGWGYTTGLTAQVEPTCWALLALAGSRRQFSEVVGRGLAALCEWQEPDGAFRVRDGRGEAVWPTALALFTLAVFDECPEHRRRAAAWLLHTRGRELPDPESVRKDFDIDPTLVGWPWTAGTFSWTEPTMWACLALTRSGWGDAPRVAEGQRLLLDRAFDDGGINYGNRLVFGRPTEPVPATTALLLLTFGGQTSHPRLAAARAYLERVAATATDLENLSWATLALNTCRREGEPIDEGRCERVRTTLHARQAMAWLPPSVVRVSLAALAMGEHNPFLGDPLPRQPEMPSLKPATPRRALGDRVQSVVRGLAVKALGHLRPMPAAAEVHIAPAESYDLDLAAILKDQFTHFRDRVPLTGKRIVLKPNLVEYHRDKVINTHPALVAAAIDLCRAEGAAEVVVAEGPGHWRNTDYLINASGLGEVLRRTGVRFVDLNHDDPVKTPNLGLLTGLEYLYLSKTVATADVVISLPKLKTHHWAGVTLSLKNLFGTLPGCCYGWPKNELHWRGIENSIVDIALTRTPDLAIVDAIVGMEGDGPLNGTARPLGAIVMGADLVAVDATCCRLMQLDPAKVGHLALAHAKKLGVLAEGQIRQLGSPVAALRQPFATLPRFAFLHAAGRQALTQPA
jgi:uncharacterized protein (DUF362 family)